MSNIKDLAYPAVDRVLIYAGDGGCYWRENGCGYTNALEAGVFTRAEAYRLAGHCGPEKRIELHDVPENHIPTLKADRDAWKARAEKSENAVEVWKYTTEQTCASRDALATTVERLLEAIETINDHLCVSNPIGIANGVDRKSVV